MKADSPALAALAAFYRKADEEISRIAALHSGLLKCRYGCSTCCGDNIKVFLIEASNIRAKHLELLASSGPYPEGACAFLGRDGECRIYADRPYVCRMQGLPFRWFEIIEPGESIELRDICPSNLPAQGIETLPAEHCLTPAPYWNRLAEFQKEIYGNLNRVSLRDMFAAD
jgi:Fe-S-cluster containining protein